MTDTILTTRNGRSTRHFIRHYVEMVIAMFLGMVILGPPAEWLFSALGTSWSDLNDHAPAMMLFAMAVTMALPMAGWMHYRGHSPRLNFEMVGSMLLPTFVLMALFSAHAISGMGMWMVVEHVAMLATMLIAMLLRRDEYSTHHGHGVAHGRIVHESDATVSLSQAGLQQRSF